MWSGAVEPTDDLQLVVADARRPTAALRGVVQDAEGRPAAARMFVMNLRDCVAYAKCDPATGAFVIDGLPPLPTPYTIHIETDVEHQRDRFPVLLNGGETTDLGVVTLAPLGTACLRVHAADGAPATEVTAAITTASGWR